MRINILLCDTFPGILPSFIESYVSMFQNLFNTAITKLAAQSEDDRERIEYLVYRAMDGELPVIENANNHLESEFYLITGCNRSVYENSEWIVNLLNWIKKAYSSGLRMVGVCFGHQAVAQALGGKVERYVGGWGIGIRQSQIMDEAMQQFWNGRTLQLLYNHHDQVITPPQAASVLATSPFCKIEGMRIDRDNSTQILTFQGHPEYVVDYERHIILNHAHNEDEEVKANALRSLEKGEHQGVKVAEFILDQMI